MENEYDEHVTSSRRHQSKVEPFDKKRETYSGSGRRNKMERIKDFASLSLFGLLAIITISFLLYDASISEDPDDYFRSSIASLDRSTIIANVQSDSGPTTEVKANNFIGIGNGVCNDQQNNFEGGYDGGDCCGPTANYDECHHCECLENIDNDGFCSDGDEDCCYEFSICDCTGTDCNCPTDGVKKCLNPGPIGQQAKIVAYAASSIFRNREKCQPKLVADRYFSKYWEEGTFHSQRTVGINQWLQLEFDKEITVHRIVFINRSTACGNRFTNIYFHIGNSALFIEELTLTNPICYFFNGTSIEYGIHDFECDQLHTGRFLVVQTRQIQYLQISELLVFDSHDTVYPVPEDTVVSSSTTNDPLNGLDKAMDSFVGARKRDFSFHTELEQFPWFQLEFPISVAVQYVVIVQRIDAEGHQFANVSMTLGDNHAIHGQLSTNPEIAFFSGPSQTGRINVIQCNSTYSGKYFQMQKIGDVFQSLMFAEILVYIDEDLCMAKDCGRSPDPEHYPKPFICD